MVTSLDAVNWTPAAIAGEPWLMGITYGAGRFVVVGDGGAVFWSADGTTWTAAGSGTSEDLSSVAFGNGLFVAVGRGGVLLTSSDGLTWAIQPGLESSLLWQVSFDGQQFMATSNDGPVFFSENGVDWTRELTLTVNSVTAACQNAGTIVAVGATADIQYRSISAITLSPTSLPSGMAGTFYNRSIVAGGGVPPYSFSITAGTLPTGINLTSEGVLAGTPATAGTYTFTITASDAEQCTGSQPYALGILPEGPPLVVSASANPTSGPAPLAVAFTGEASGGLPPYAYSWDYGDGSPASSSPSHTYSTAGSYSATVTVTDAAGEMAVATIAINALEVSPPVVQGMTKRSDPFRIVATGSNLQEGIQVFIGDSSTPWSPVAWKSTSKIVIKGGRSLRAVVPKGTTTRFKFVNPDGGSTVIDLE